MSLCEATIKENRPISVDFYRMTLSFENSLSPLAGQFLSIQLPLQSKMILRRPFAYSAYDAKKKEASIIYQKRGEGTALLTQHKVGEKLSLLTDLGNSFPLPTDNQPTSKELFKTIKKLYLVSGGVGLGPMLFTHYTLTQHSFPNHLIAGFRSKNYLPDIKELSPLKDKCSLCSDDGSFGFKGTVVDFLKTIDNAYWSESAIYACGPIPMMRSLHHFAQSVKAPLFVSMEEMMGCAVGACMGCIVKTVDEKGYARVCKEGPIFDSRQLVWEESPTPSN